MEGRLESVHMRPREQVLLSSSEETRIESQDDSGAQSRKFGSKSLQPQKMDAMI